jgi:hypothetical protein
MLVCVVQLNPEKEVSEFGRILIDLWRQQKNNNMLTEKKKKKELTLRGQGRVCQIN